jgi:2-keto-3-deoxy-L-rhamnonate aldolase RhmA
MEDLHDAVGTWCSLSDPAVAEVAAGGGVDFAVIDTEHAPLGLEPVADCLRAVAARDCTGLSESRGCGSSGCWTWVLTASSSRW